jgi:Lon protease-like protein
VAEIGLFPLDLVLLPGERLPMHVFEDRYKELIGACLGDGSEFGLILENAQGLRAVGTSVVVSELIDTFEDGRMNVLMEGRGRFRVLELTEGRSYRTAVVEAFEDTGEAPSEDEVERALMLLSDLTDADIDEWNDGQGPLSFHLAAAADLGHDAKQELLELRSERARLRHFEELAEQSARRGGERATRS